MRIIFMGTPHPVVSTLETLCGLGFAEVVAAVTPPDRERGRGRRPESPPVKEAAERLGIPVLQPRSLRPQDVVNTLRELSPDLVVVAAYGRLLPPAVLGLPRYGCLNLHPSLLPRHRGPSPVATAILEGDVSTGITLMLLDEGMDTGPVIAKREYALTGEETAGELTNLLFDMGAQLLAESLRPWTCGELQAQAQDDTRATISRKLEREDGLADWRLPAMSLSRQCRAYAPWPGMFTHWNGKMLKVLKASAVRGWESAEAAPGQVVAIESGRQMFASTGEGLLALERVQLEGRKAVTGEEFLRGYPNVVGDILDA